MSISILAESTSPLFSPCLQLLSFPYTRGGRIVSAPSSCITTNTPESPLFLFPPTKTQLSWHWEAAQCSYHSKMEHGASCFAGESGTWAHVLCCISALFTPASFPCSLCCCISYIMSMCNVHPSILWMKLFIFELQEYQRKYLLSKVVLISVWNKCFCKPLRSWNSWNKWNWSTRLHEAYFFFPFSPPYAQCSNGSSEEQVEKNLSFHCIHFQLLLFISNGFGMLCLWTNVSKRSNWNHSSPF